MSKTIFSKLMITTMAIILLSFTIAGIFLYGLLGEYAVKDKEQTLKHYASRVVQLAEYLAENNNPIIQGVFRINIEAYAQNSSSKILIVDTNGKIILAAPQRLLYLEGKHIDKEFLEQMIVGNEIRSVKNLGNLFSEPHLTLGYPIKYNERIIGGVFMNTPVPEEKRLRSEVYSLFLRAIGLSMLFAAVSIYFMSSRISQPLGEIGKVAKKIAAGDFETRLVIKNDDEIGELGKTFNFMADALCQTEKMRKNFIANVSHEMRTPMTSIIGFVEGMIDGTIPDEKHQHYLAVVKNETMRLTRLVNNLLDLSRMESGEEQLKIMNFDICELIRRNIIKFETQINSKNLNVEVNLHQENQLVEADMDNIERVITNLMDNAIKFTSEGGKIIVQTKRKNDIVEISIKDTGIGIDKDELPYIWERFYKTDKSRSKDKVGTGLGLAIIKNIIKMHKQNIWVESEVNKGSIFTFTIQSL